MTPLWRKLKTAFRLTFPDWLILFQAYLSFLKTRGQLWLQPFDTLKKVLSGEAPPSEPVPANETRLLDLFDIARRNQFPKPNCLLTSLAKNDFLSRRRIPSRLHIGIKKDGKELKAHAWCEISKKESSDSCAGFEKLV